MNSHIRTLLKSASALAIVSASSLSATAALSEEIVIWCWDPNFNVAIMEEAGFCRKVFLG